MPLHTAGDDTLVVVCGIGDGVEAILSNRLFVPRELVEEQHTQAFTYQIESPNLSADCDDDDGSYIVETFREFSDSFGFCRGDLGKLRRVFSDVTIVDKRARSPFPRHIDLKFTGTLEPEQEKVIGRYLEYEYGIIECPPRWGKCCDGDSLIPTDRGLFKLRDLFSDHPSGTETSKLRVGVASLGGVAHTSHRHAKHAKRTLKLTSHLGFEIIGTPEHPVLVLERDLKLCWKRLDAVRPGDHAVAVARGQQLFSSTSPHLQHEHLLPTSMTDELARLLGYFVSEGGIGYGQSSITNTDQDLLADFQHCYKACFGVDPDCSVDARNGVVTAGSSQQWAADVLSYLGLPRGVSADHEVPWSVLQSTRSHVVQFLRAYFDGDGWEERNHIGVVSASRKLLAQVQVLLASMGVVGRLRPRMVQLEGWDAPREYYELRLSGLNIKAFYETVGFGLKRKLRYTNIRRKHDGTHTLPFADNVLRALTGKLKSGGWYQCADGVQRQLRFSTGISAGVAKYNASHQYLVDHPELIAAVGHVDRELAGRLAALADLDGFSFDVVTSVEEAGERPVFDLTVPATHCFVANGILAHNTVASTAMICQLRQKALVLVHTYELAEQWMEAFEDYTNALDIEGRLGRQIVGISRAGKPFRPFDCVTIATYQQLLTKRGAALLRELSDTFGLVIVDECHHARADGMARVLNRLNSKYRIGVTATPYDSRYGTHVIAHDVIGPVTARGTTQPLTSDITLVYTGVNIDCGKQWTTYVNRVCRNEKRNRIVMDWIAHDLERHSILVTTDRRQHCIEYAEMLQKKLGVKVAAVHGLLPKPVRREIRMAARRGDVQVVVAMNKLVQEGYNVPRWSAFHNMCPLTSPENWYQRSSRVRTRYPRDEVSRFGPYDKPRPIIRVYYDQVKSSMQKAYLRMIERESAQAGMRFLRASKVGGAKVMPTPRPTFDIKPEDDPAAWD